MNERVTPIDVEGASRQRKRQARKGGRVNAAALADVHSVLGKELRRDLLIEYLHRINDHFGQLSAPHLAALAQKMKLAQTEVDEIATFYHRFEVVKEGPDGRAPATIALTVRVCDALSCETAGA